MVTYYSFKIAYNVSVNTQHAYVIVIPTNQDKKTNFIHIMTLTIGLAKLHANPCLVLAEILEEAIQHFMMNSLKLKVPQNELKNHSRNTGFILQKEI